MVLIEAGSLTEAGGEGLALVLIEAGGLVFSPIFMDQSNSWGNGGFLKTAQFFQRPTHHH